MVITVVPEYRQRSQGKGLWEKLRLVSGTDHSVDRFRVANPKPLLLQIRFHFFFSLHNKKSPWRHLIEKCPEQGCVGWHSQGQSQPARQDWIFQVVSALLYRAVRTLLLGGWMRVGRGPRFKDSLNVR